MALIFRTSSLENTVPSFIKNAPLTYEEGDGNFAYLLRNMSGSTVTIQGATTVTGSLEVIGPVTTFDGVGFWDPITLDFIQVYAYDGGLILTGSLQGTASWANNTIAAQTASFVTASNVYGPYGASSVKSASFAVSTSWAPFMPSDTGSLLVTASSTNNVVTFTKGNSTQFSITIATGSATQTGSLLTTASVSLNTITFTKGDGSTFPITVDTGSGGGGGIPGGLDTEIQFKSGSNFAGTGSFRYIYTSQSLEQGSELTASGQHSHAEGQLTYAASDYSHAEGYDTQTTITTAYSGSATNTGTVITLSGSYGDATSKFPAEGTLYIYTAPNPFFIPPSPFGDVTNYLISRSYYSAPNTIIEIYNDDLGSPISAEDTQVLVGNISENGYGTVIGSTQGILGLGTGWQGDQAVPAQSSHAEGNKTLAVGPHSHAEGGYSVSLGVGAHTEGITTLTLGQYSHAEGQGTQAVGYASHAEGIGAVGGFFEGGGPLIAYGDYSHAEGANALALGDYSHAEGAVSRTGYYKLAYSASIQSGIVTMSAEYGDLATLGIFNSGGTFLIVDKDGDGTRITEISRSYYSTPNTIVELTENITYFQNPYVANLSISTATWLRGNQTMKGNGAHAEGEGNVAVGFASHAEGAGTLAAADYSHAEGEQAEALAYASHAEGYGTRTKGDYSHAEGESTQARGYASHAEGNQTTAIGDYSHTAGLETVASGSYQSVIGQYNISSSVQSAFIIGNGTSNINRSNLLFASGSQVQITGSLDVSQGITGSLFGTASWAVSASWAVPLAGGSDTQIQFNSASRLMGTGSLAYDYINNRLSLSGSAVISGSGTQVLRLIGSGSSAPLFQVLGSQGELFTVTDSLSGSLFSVNDISGLPIVEAFSDSTVLIGNYQAPALNTTILLPSTVTSSANIIYTVPTGSYDAVYMDYVIRSGSVGRAGTFTAMWSGSSTSIADVSVTPFGDTSGFVFGANISGSNLLISGSCTTAGWRVKTIIRSI